VAKLGAFAVMNMAMAPVTPILGQRDVMEKMTFGLCDHRGSELWKFTRLLTAVLYIWSNAVAAMTIKHTPGIIT
jgi:hypothetical protein